MLVAVVSLLDGLALLWFPPNRRKWLPFKPALTVGNLIVYGFNQVSSDGFEFPDIARPGILLKQFNELCRKTTDEAAAGFAVNPNKVLKEHGDVASPIA